MDVDGCAYTPGPDWTPAMIEAYAAMPTLGGHVVSLFLVPKQKVRAYEREWGEWSRKFPKSLWPIWLHRWIENRIAERKKAAQ